MRQSDNGQNVTYCGIPFSRGYLAESPFGLGDGGGGGGGGKWRGNNIEIVKYAVVTD